MLVGFFKKDEEKDCKCQVVKCSDRIWLDKNGNASFLRSFVIRVLPDSPLPLTEVKLLLPVEHILDIKSSNDSYFQEQYYFNQPHIRTTNTYKITKSPETNSYNSYGLINDDGIDDIKIFTAGEYAAPKLFRFDKCTVLRFRIPDAVKPGEVVGWRFSFRVSSLFDNVVGNDLLPEYNVPLSYFSKLYNDEIVMLGGQNEIDIIPTLEGENHPGGFDIWLYLPPRFMKVSGFDDATEKIDHRTMDGTEGDPQVKFGWKLRWLLKKHGRPENTPMNSTDILGLNLDINGVIKQRYDSAADLKKVCESVEAIPVIDGTVQKMKKEVRVSTILAIVAIILSIIIPFGIELFKKIFLDFR